MLRVLIVALALGMLLPRDSPAQSQCPELPFHLLVPFDYPCPIHPRVCRTDYGYCRLGMEVEPGTPCHCWAATTGQWYPGVCSR